LTTIQTVIANLYYTLLEPQVLNTLFYKVPQQRERLFLVGIRNDLAKFAKFSWPSPHCRIFALKDALKAGEL